MTINIGTLVPILVSIVTGGLSCVFFIISWQRKRKEDVTRDWQSTSGVILESEVKTYSTVDQTNVNKTIITPMVRYQYSIGGNSYTGYRLTFDEIEYTLEKARQKISQYPPGNSVTVYYDSLHPDESVVERSTRGFRLMFTTGLVLSAVCLSSCFISLLVYWIGKAVQ
jgi:hypothetical protein